MIVLGFAGLGKTYVGNSGVSGVVDISTGRYRYVGQEAMGIEEYESLKGSVGREERAGWLGAVVDDIERYHKQGKVVLTAPKEVVYEAIKQRGYDVVLVVPTEGFLYGELTERYRRRGNTEDFIEKAYRSYSYWVGCSGIERVEYVKGGYMSDWLKARKLIDGKER